MTAIDMLERGEVRVARVDQASDQVRVDERARRAILLAFRVLGMTTSSAGPFHYNDRIPVKHRFPGVRVVPGAIARRGSYHAAGVILMPSFTNVGAFVDSGTLIDTWATVGSCAQIGRNVHVSGGAGIGGVLEPPGAVPVVIEDDCFIGSRSLVVEGARVRVGAKLGAGVVFTGSTPVIDAQSGAELPRGEVPPWSVCVGGTRLKAFAGGEFGLPCLLVVKRLKEGERHDKLAIDALFREHGSAG
jgi:2,3,4,5-tetrahydropyridine-2-carboxylate N-succinyltransferase